MIVQAGDLEPGDVHNGDTIIAVEPSDIGVVFVQFEDKGWISYQEYTLLMIEDNDQKS